MHHFKRKTLFLLLLVTLAYFLHITFKNVQKKIIGLQRDESKYLEIPNSDSNEIGNTGEKLNTKTDAQTSTILSSRANKTLTGNIFDRYCYQNGEWKEFGKAVFVKRSAVYFFFDLDLVRVHAVLRSHQRFHFTLEIKVSLNGSVILKEHLQE